MLAVDRRELQRDVVRRLPALIGVFSQTEAEHPIDQATLIARSGLPKRTVQGALNYLVGKGLVRTVSEPSDMRRHKYALD